MLPWRQVLPDGLHHSRGLLFEIAVERTRHFPVTKDFLTPHVQPCALPLPGPLRRTNAGLSR